MYHYLIPKNVKAKMLILFKYGFKETGIILAFATFGVLIGLPFYFTNDNALISVLAGIAFGGIGAIVVTELEALNTTVLHKIITMYHYFKNQKRFFYVFGGGRKEMDNTAQGLIPITDINNHFIQRRDNQLVSIVNVTPFNLTLLSEQEQYQKIKQLEQVLNGITGGYQMVALNRPVDLSGYRTSLEQKINETDNLYRRSLLEKYVEQCNSLITGGKVAERQFFLIFSLPIKNLKNKAISEDELRKKVFAVVAELNAMEMPSKALSNQELREVLFTVYHPNQASFEKVPQTNEQLMTSYQQG